MKLLLLLLLGTFPVLLGAQTDSLLPPKPASRFELIMAARQELKTAFLADDPAAAGLWMDSLARLENRNYQGLIWDERWLLYFWEEAYGNIFDEVGRFPADQESRRYKINPTADSLFETLDQTLYAQRFDLYNRMQQGFLNGEEKAFSVLLLDYLLRLNQDEKEWAARLDAFLKLYPDSRFADFIRSIRPAVVGRGNRGFGFSLSLLKGDWTGQLDRSIRTPYAGEFNFYLWRKGWHYELNAAPAEPALDRRITHRGFDWLAGDGTYFRNTGLMVGRDMLDNDRLRVTPALGLYHASLSPAPPEEGENPDYYSEFYFGDLHVSTSLTLDMKMFRSDGHLQGIEKGTFNGLRLRFGYHWLRLGRQNPAFGGNLFYFALGYHFFVQRPSK